ncbi:TolC family protein [Shewanella inventionis]|uniref:Transporter n=1 Tax=Shewanella inventionis TaxID=1738770 RepID=A0ABQ1J8H5_9GAMM|nr:TolC family protein [Shewanella inventionis]MCL1157978.1 TolC family protein [Shewanella inventionis]GGB62655.1 transporter [Shewanella inventionis]
MIVANSMGRYVWRLTRVLGLAVLSITALANTSVAYAENMSFSQAWSQLLHVSDQLQAKNQLVNRAKAKEAAGDALNYPSLNVAGSYTRLEKPIELDLQDLNPLASLDVSSLPSAVTEVLATIPSSMYVTPFTEQDVFRASLQAMWPIYTGGRITAAQGIHAAQVSESESEFALAQRELFLQLVERYYAVSVTQTLAETQKQLVDSLSLHVSHAEKLEQQGQIAKVERLNAQVALENAKVDWGKAKRQYEMADIALARMLHVPKVNPSTDLFMLEQQPSLSRLSQLTLSEHPALTLLEAKEAQANGLVDLEKGGYYPTVYLYGNYTLYEDDSLFSQVEPNWLVGVGVSVPLISRDGHSGKVLAAKSALLQARYTKAQTRQDLSLLVDQSYRQMLQAKEEVDALDVSLALATENLRLRELAFNQGLSTSIDRVDAELSLTAVKTKQLGAQYRYMQAYAKVMAISGQVDDYINRTQIQGASNADQ